MTKTAVVYDKWLSSLGGGEKVAFYVTDILLAQGYETTFIYGHRLRPELLTRLQARYPNVTFEQLWNDEVKLKRRTKEKDLFVNISFMDYSYGHARKNVYYVHFPTPPRSMMFNLLLLFFKQTGLHRFLPPTLRERISDRIRAGVYIDLEKRLDSYQTFIVHSEYVRKWVKRYWGKEAAVLYPPVRLLTPPDNAEKLNRIVSVGRFFTLGHGKKQEIMIEAFKKLCDQELKGWELHLIGGLGTEPSSQRFMDRLREEAKGYPVCFHINAKREELEDVLLKSKIYWHAAGYGENPDRDPVKQEHFGIAPVEAMSAGCIPLLYDGGGLREIIEKVSLPVNENLFTSVEGLAKKTMKMIDENQVSLPPGIHARLIQAFSHGRFETEFKKLLA